MQVCSTVIKTILCAVGPATTAGCRERLITKISEPGVKTIPCLRYSYIADILKGLRRMANLCSVILI